MTVTSYQVLENIVILVKVLQSKKHQPSRLIIIIQIQIKAVGYVMNNLKLEIIGMYQEQ